MTTTAAPYVVNSRYPFTIAEYFTMLIGGVGVGGGLALLYPGASFLLTLLPGFILGAAGCWWASWSRKKKSQVDITIDGDVLSVFSRGFVGQGAVRMSQITVINMKTVGARECFMMREATARAGDRQGAVYVPALALDDPTLYATVERQINLLREAPTSVKRAFDVLPQPS